VEREVAQQAAGRAGPPVPLLGEVLDPAAVDGDEGELRRDEEPVDQDQQDDSDQCERSADGAGSPVGRAG
jgi:hypothetical protein